MEASSDINEDSNILYVSFIDLMLKKCSINEFNKSDNISK